MLIPARSFSQAKKSADNLTRIRTRIAILRGCSQAGFQYLTGGIDG
jgi:hypothetical protein